jgi:hypothetical protein
MVDRTPAETCQGLALFIAACRMLWNGSYPVVGDPKRTCPSSRTIFEALGHLSLDDPSGIYGHDYIAMIRGFSAFCDRQSSLGEFTDVAV